MYRSCHFRKTQMGTWLLAAMSTPLNLRNTSKFIILVAYLTSLQLQTSHCLSITKNGKSSNSKNSLGTPLGPGPAATMTNGASGVVSQHQSPPNQAYQTRHEFSLRQKLAEGGKQMDSSTIRSRSSWPPMSPSMSTSNSLDSTSQSVQATRARGQDQQTPTSLNQVTGSSMSSAKQLSITSANANQIEGSPEEDPDLTPLATINNHSGSGSGSRPLVRPTPGETATGGHQYADYGGLVGRATNPAGSNFSSIQVSHHQTLGYHNLSREQQHHHHSPGYSNSSTSGQSGSGGKTRTGNLPECATQQVCNAIFVRMNYTQRLCECSGNYNWKCSNTLDPQDGHTIELTRKFDKRIYTQIKTCEPLREVRACKSPSDWTLLALQSERSGKAHYVVVCKCPTWAQLEGPYTHNHPPYANIPGIRVYGMLCAHQTARSSVQTYATYNPALSIYPEFPWAEALSVANSTNLSATLNSLED